ncbi:MAG TPA: hypothetical protein PKD86_00935 [Gemmatales bacterium]|nr:hypothetical protein [Gemmatales bacterium]HMP57888.1 hypothetical protein [Gemmatales bacterium]
MCKKLLLVGGVLLVAVWVSGSATGREAMSYLSTGWKEMRLSFKKVVPLDFEIKRAENLLASLDKTDERLVNALAAQIQGMQRLERDVETAQGNVERMKAELQILNDEVKNRLASGTNLETDRKLLNLERKLKEVKTAEGLLRNKSAAKEQGQQRLEFIKTQRENLREQRLDLEQRIVSLRTNLEMLKASELKNKHALTDEQLADVQQLKELVDRLEEQIETRVIELKIRQDEVPTSSTRQGRSGTNVTVEIDSYLGRGEVAGK